MAFLEIHFAHRVNGPDFLSGHQLDLLFEEWQYAWTPNVEGELISLSEKGSQLETIALNKLLAMEKQLAEQGQSRSSQKCGHFVNSSGINWAPPAYPYAI